MWIAFTFLAIIGISCFIGVLTDITPAGKKEKIPIIKNSSKLRWISVNEELPQHEGDYHIITKSGANGMAFFYEDCKSFDILWALYGEANNAVPEVEYWLSGNPEETQKVTPRKNEIIDGIKDMLLRNAVAEYENGLKDCDDIVSRDRSKYQKENQRLFEERVSLMQDYEDVTFDDYKEEDLNFKYE